MENRIVELEQQILRAKQAYYFGGTPIMNDEAYDALETALESIDPNNKVLAIVGAPIPPENQLKRAKHSRPMGSQEKIHNTAELNKWLISRGKPETLHASFKGDGGSIAAYYEKGRLIQVITRGDDGSEGEDITANAICFKGLPARLCEPLSCSVRCEAVLTIVDWEIVDPELKTNPRNVANGILGRLDGRGAQHITALAFDIDVPEIKTEQEKELLLCRLGFTPPVSFCGNVTEIIAFREETIAKRKKGILPYWIDGIVLKINNVANQVELGVSNNRPKGQIAWKFEAEGGTSKILAVTWEVGHTGAITPVAQIQPIKIGGTTISNVSLANPSLISALGLTLNATVRVIKAGDIIPQIQKVLTIDNSSPILIPKICPVCSSKLTKKDNVDGSKTVVIYCENQSCEARVLGKIKRWVQSRDILGLGESVIRALLAAELVESVAQLYTLKPEEMQDLMLGDESVKLGSKRATNICAEIKKKATTMTLAEFLGGFGTRSLGVKRASLMINANPELENIERWFDGSLLVATFSKAAGVPQSGATIFASLQTNEPSIRATAKFVKITGAKQATVQQKTICITGTLKSGRKKAFYKEPLEKAGYTLVDEVTKELSLLVVSDTTQESSKSKRAQKLGIRIIDESELENIIQ